MDGIERFIDCFMSHGAIHTTVYMLSIDNLLRPPEELADVANAEADFLTKTLPALLARHGASARVVGNPKLAPQPLRAAATAIGCPDFTPAARQVHLLIAYDPWAELRATSPRSLDDLWIPLALDLVVRTSGEMRLSNFMPFQSGYAEFVFIRESICEVDDGQWDSTLSEYARRTRRYGQ